ncbi:MAG: RsmB/NOP family class I SAM-dependent RNA methyltransferase [Magnetovibrio sp.]|nr:RsmB/NOP family class I SAM-dependent RNA methyltransferase [Magnetovibrio sp.]
MTPAARTEAAIYLLGKIADERRPADDIVRAWFQARRFVGAQARRAIRERVYGCLRRINRLDWHLSQVAFGQNKSARLRVLVDVVLEGSDATQYFNSLPHGPGVLSEAEEELVEALNGKKIDDPEQPAHVQVELPQWLSDKLKIVYAGTFMAEMMAMNIPAPMDLRVALGRVSRDQAQKALGKIGVKSYFTEMSPMGLTLQAHTDIARTPAFKKGFVEVQDEGSQILSLLVGAKAYMNVVDFCAGAGGKTLAIADRMGLQDGHSKGRLVASDIDSGRLARMDKRLHRAKLTDKIEQEVYDPNNPWTKGVEETFDRVLVDAPCSGSGTWRRHPEQKKRLTEDRLNELMGMQDEVLRSSATLVKPGGRLIYATCSLLRDENEDRVDAFLKNHPDFYIVPIQTVWAETIKKSECPDMDESKFLRLTPHSHDTDGFFVAIFERKI